jgi:uncharacterized OB-fold protein|tara:strand:- start:17184 stop:17507 length:324 start_codon:yes stop_codon:yes gene_type:complete
MKYTTKLIKLPQELKKLIDKQPNGSKFVRVATEEKLRREEFKKNGEIYVEIGDYTFNEMCFSEDGMYTMVFKKQGTDLTMLKIYNTELKKRDLKKIEDLEDKLAKDK